MLRAPFKLTATFGLVTCDERAWSNILDCTRGMPVRMRSWGRGANSSNAPAPWGIVGAAQIVGTEHMKMEPRATSVLAYLSCARIPHGG